METDTRLTCIISERKAGRTAGIYSVCTYNRYVLEAAFMQALDDGSNVLIESTCNQVNHLGGYTGMTPEDFKVYVREIAKNTGFPVERLIVAGDHLGPYPFRSRPGESAMAEAQKMVESYVLAGCTKIHLDTSMAVADDPGGESAPLDKPTIARRCALLCETAEKTYRENAGAGDPAPVYIIGTEVPAPGGSDEVEEGLVITSPEDFEETLSIHREMFMERGLNDAWERVIAVVVQPGVEHGDHTIVEYDRSKTVDLTAALKKRPGIVFEGHATDYQTATGLRQMVEDGIAILKVGPSLTLAVRETVFMLGEIEHILAGIEGFESSRIAEVMEEAMERNPVHWRQHYTGTDAEVAFKRRYSFFDRIRYYWVDNEVKRALEMLVRNLRGTTIPLSLLSQYLPDQYRKVREGALKCDPEAFIRDRVIDILKNYSSAVGFRG